MHRITPAKHRWLAFARHWVILLALLLQPLPSRAEARDRAPADAPRLPSGALELAPLPRDFDTLDAGWLHIAYPASLSAWAERLLAEGTDFRRELRKRIGQPVLSEVRVRLALNPPQMAKLAPVNAPFPKYAEGVAYSRIGLILLTSEPVHANAEHDVLETFRHELAHVALHDAVGGHRVPLWFNEGLAVHLSRENTFARVRALWIATVSGNLIPLNEIERRFPRDPVGVPLAYAQSADIVRFLIRQQDQERFRLLIKRIRRGQLFDRALYDSYALDAHTLEHDWRTDVESRYSFWPLMFSGTAVWGGAMVLAVVAWRRKRKRHKVTLARWAKEEAVEDERAARLKEVAAVVPWIVAQGSRQRSRAPDSSAPVPKVEHEGDWHTLH